MVFLMGESYTRPTPLSTIASARSTKPSSITSGRSAYAMPKYAAGYYTPKTHNLVSNWLDTSQKIVVPQYVRGTPQYIQYQAQKMEVFQTMKHFNNREGPGNIKDFLKPASMHSYDPSRSGYSVISGSGGSSASRRTPGNVGGLALVTGLAAAGVGAGVGIGVAVGNAISQNTAPSPPRSVTLNA